MRDGWGTVQIVVEGGEEIRVLPESVIEGRGQVRAQPQAPEGIEIARPQICVITKSAVSMTPASVLPIIPLRFSLVSPLPPLS